MTEAHVQSCLVVDASARSFASGAPLCSAGARRRQRSLVTEIPCARAALLHRSRWPLGPLLARACRPCTHQGRHLSRASAPPANVSSAAGQPTTRGKRSAREHCVRACGLTVSIPSSRAYQLHGSAVRLLSGWMARGWPLPRVHGLPLLLHVSSCAQPLWQPTSARPTRMRSCPLRSRISRACIILPCRADDSLRVLYLRVWCVFVRPAWCIS